MSTTLLTVTMAATVIIGLFLEAGVELYRRRLAAASFTAAAGFVTFHIAFIAIAWQAAATVAEEEPYPAVASLPTAAYDAPAWAAVAFLATGIILAALQWRRERVMKKQLEQFFERCLFGHNEAKED